MHGDRALCAALGYYAQLAVRRRTLDNLGRRGLCVMLELGFNVTEYGKAILASCFINDLGTVIALE